MSNPNVRKDLDTLARVTTALAKHVTTYSGVGKDAARDVIMSCEIILAQVDAIRVEASKTLAGV